MTINIKDISPIKGATYYVNVEPTAAEVAMFPKPVTFKVVEGNSFKIISYKANGDRLVMSSDKHYIHRQAEPMAIWHFPHPLGKKVAVTVQDTAGSEIEGEVSINDGYTVEIKFNYPFSGEALLN